MSRRWLFVGGIAVGVVLAVGVTLAITLTGSSKPAAAPITDSSLCSDVNALGSDPTNSEFRYLALNQALGSRSGFDLTCHDNPNMPVTEALAVAPGRELEFQSSVEAATTG